MPIFPPATSADLGPPVRHDDLPATGPGVIVLRKPRRRTVVVAVGVVAMLVLVSTVALNHPKRVSLGGITFEVPASWAVHTDIPPTTGPGSTLALLGTLPWGDCANSDINCHYQERLSRNEIEVEVSLVSLLGGDYCAFARQRPDLEPRSDGIRVTETHYFRIDGRPAIMTDYSLDTSDYYGSDGWREWEIAPADTTGGFYRIFAKWRGPDDGAFLAGLDRLIGSIDLGPSGQASYPVPDCGDPFPAAATSNVGRGTHA
jgi:hypothetical protein